MWYSQQHSQSNKHCVLFSIHQDTSPVSYKTVIHGWQHDVTFRDFFLDLLTKSPFAAFRWETPPVTTDTVHRPFECVLIDSPGLARSSDRQTFAQYFKPQQSVVTFFNLGRDARLVVPCPTHLSDDYSHLGTFLHQAPQAQQHALWRAVGNAMAKRLGAQPVWLSTAGDGVAWLNIRLDDHPKYYHHGPYRRHR